MGWETTNSLVVRENGGGKGGGEGERIVRRADVVNGPRGKFGTEGELSLGTTPTLGSFLFFFFPLCTGSTEDWRLTID